MRYYAVIDTNVLVSALLRSASVPGAVMQEALEGRMIPLLNDAILEEYRKCFVVTPREMLEILEQEAL